MYSIDDLISRIEDHDGSRVEEPEPSSCLSSPPASAGKGRRMENGFSCERCYHFRKPYCLYTGRRERADFDLCPMILTGPVGDIGAPLDAAAPEEPAEPRDRGACPICKRGRWWRVMEDTWRCGVCHPPAVADMAEEWFMAKDEVKR